MQNNGSQLGGALTSFSGTFRFARGQRLFSNYRTRCVCAATARALGVACPDAPRARISPLFARADATAGFLRTLIPCCLTAGVHYGEANGFLASFWIYSR